MAETEDLLNKIKKQVDLQKRCAKKFTALADELEETSLVTSVSSVVIVTSKSKDAMKEAKQIVEELQELDKEIQDLMKPLKPGGDEGQPSGSCDDGDAKVMEQLLRSEAKRQGLDLSPSVDLRTMCGLPQANISRKIMANSVLLAGSETVLSQVLMLAAEEGGKAAGYVAGGAVGLSFSVPELVSDCQNLDICGTRASRTLRGNAEAVRTAAEEMEKELQKIREALQKWVRIKFIVKKKKRSSDEKSELIQHLIENSQNEVGKQWLREKPEHFFILLDLFNFITKKVDEEDKKKKRYRNGDEFDLIFVAHGGINNFMIPARCYLPLPSITDVVLYSPWNCAIDAPAAYGITTGRIKPGDRVFTSQHEPSSLPSHWNSMRDSGTQPVPVIMVRPIATPGDDAFSALLSLEAMFGQPGADRYVIPFLAPDIGAVPFFVVMMALSLVLLFSNYKAKVHLAACLSKTCPNITLDENYLKQQYCYTVDHTIMSVTQDSIRDTNPQLFDMLKTVFG